MRTTKITLAVAGLILIAGTAFAATPDKSDYGFNNGVKQQEARSATFENVKAVTNDADRKALFEEYNIGTGSAYAGQDHLDVDSLVKAKVIDQKTANGIKAYASKKHETISGGYAAANFREMTPKQRGEFHAKMNEKNLSGDTVDSLLKNGLITKAQADSINRFLGK